MPVIENPPVADKKKWGILAHVSPEERARIMSLSHTGEHGAFEQEQKRIERELNEIRRKNRKRKY